VMLLPIIASAILWCQAKRQLCLAAMIPKKSKDRMAYHPCGRHVIRCRQRLDAGVSILGEHNRTPDRLFRAAGHGGIPSSYGASYTTVACCAPHLVARGSRHPSSGWLPEYEIGSAGKVVLACPREPLYHFCSVFS